MTLDRQGGSNLNASMDNLIYHYYGNTNMLEYVDDNAQNIPTEGSDIKRQYSDNYRYDEIGQLVYDAQEGIDDIEWLVTNKVSKITRNSSSPKPDLEFRYDALGNRIMKIVKPQSAGPNPNEYTTTYYVRDVQGNILTTYTKTEDNGYLLAENTLYGSKRLGAVNRNKDIINCDLVDGIYPCGKPAESIVKFTGNSRNDVAEIHLYVEGVDISGPVIKDGDISLTAIHNLIVSAVNSYESYPNYTASMVQGQQSGVKINSLEGNDLLNGLYVESTLTYIGGQSGSSGPGDVNLAFESTLPFTGGLAPGMSQESITSCVTGNVRYELSNHLGNVTQTISDKKLLVYDNGDYIASADVKSYSDYYPFGSQMPGRHGSEGSEYRYGYQGSEKDDEVKGSGNSYTTKFRMYDPRIGRWLTRDPKHNAMPWESPYSYSNNSPIIGNDPDGDICTPCIQFIIGFTLDVVDQMAGELMDGASFSEAWDEVSLWSATISGGFSAANPSALAAKFAKSPTIRKIVAEAVEVMADMIQSAVNSYYKEGEVDVYDVLMEALYGPSYRKLSKSIPVKTPKLDQKIKVNSGQLDRQQRITNPNSSSGRKSKLVDLQNQQQKLTSTKKTYEASKNQIITTGAKNASKGGTNVLVDQIPGNTNETNSDSNTNTQQKRRTHDIIRASF